VGIVGSFLDGFLGGGGFAFLLKGGAGQGRAGHGGKGRGEEIPRAFFWKLRRRRE